MYDLTQLEKPNGNRPVIMTIAGEAGLGKTTLAASFPNPVMIRLEDGSMAIQGMDVAMFPLCQSSTDAFNQITALATTDHSFKTLIIDSVTQLNTMIEGEVVASDPKAKSINQANGGYGAGNGAVAEVHRKLRDWCGSLSSRKQMNIIFISHADSETVRPPDNEDYTRYTLRMHPKSASHYVDNVDCVAFIKQKTLVVGNADSDKKISFSDGTRIITCHPVASHVSKNRFGIDKDLPFIKGENPFKPFLPQLGA